MAKKIGLIIFDEPKVWKEADIRATYPNCEFLMRVKEPLDDFGELLAVCGDPDYYADYCKYIDKVGGTGILAHLGSMMEVHFATLYPVTE